MQVPKSNATKASNATNATPSVQERRNNTRISVNLPVVVSGSPVSGRKEARGTIVNVSQRGLSLAAPVALESGTIVKLRFLWPPTRFCTAQGEIIRTQSNRFAISLSQVNASFEQLVHALSLSEPEEIETIMKSMLSCVLDAKKP